MKYAIISDIHGNLPAFTAVLNDAQKQGVYKYIFVGDYYMSLPYPNEVIDIVKSHPNSYVIRGNHEDYLKNLATQNQQDWKQGQMSTLYWYFNNITKQNLEYLSTLPHQIHFKDNTTAFYIAHSSDKFIGDIELRELSPIKIALKYKDKPFSRTILLRDIHEYFNNDIEFHEKNKSLSNGIYIFGHTHSQWHFKVGEKLFINPGSCGLPSDLTPGAPYTILEVNGDSWNIDERRIDYDIESLTEDLICSNLYKEAQVWSEIIIKNLRTGKEHVYPFLLFAEEYANQINDNVRPFSLKTWTEAYDIWKTHKDFFE